MKTNVIEEKTKLIANKLAVMADSVADYERLGLSSTKIAPWEDGKRTDDSAGTLRMVVLRRAPG